MGMNYGYYIYPYSIESMAEVLLKADSRGAIAVFSSGGMSDAEGKHILDQGLFETIFPAAGVEVEV